MPFKIFKTMYEKLFVADKWNIGYTVQTPEGLIKSQGLSTITWLKEDNVDYAADPFIVSFDAKTYIYYEELSFWTGKGTIQMIDEFHFKNKKLVNGIKPKKIHLSYPFIFKQDNKIYCVPETSSALEIALYEINPSQPEQLFNKQVLIKGKNFVDSSIIFYQNKYWLFTSVSKETNQLYLYFSDSLQQEFKPHASNPILVEPKMSRSAGSLFIVDGILYRPSQNSVDHYGSSLIINKISHLDEETFNSEKCFHIFPQRPYKRGLHNISFSKNYIVIDGKRKSTSILMPLKKIAKKMFS